MLYDCAIVGAGAAGLNAALVLGRARKSVILLDDNRPRNAVTQKSHGFITRDGVSPSEFRRLALEEVLRYPSVQHLVNEVTDIRKSGDEFELLLQSTEHVRSKKLILATGLREEFPHIDGLSQFYGKSLFNCPFCDGWELKDQPLVIVSENPIILEKVGIFYNWSQDLIICTNGHYYTTDEQKDRLKSKGIAVIEKPIAAFTGSDGKLEKVCFEDGTDVKRTGGFITPKWIPRATFQAQLGYQTIDFGGIVTDAMGRSTVAGVYAAGDAAYVLPSQVIYAAADGNRAAASVTMDIALENF